MKIQKISIALSLALILLVAVAGSLYANLPTRYFDNIQANGYAVVDGQEDANQLRVQGYTTQTTNLAVVEQSDGDDKVAITNAGAITITTDAGTDLVNVLTGSLKIGNGTPGTTLNGEDVYIEGTLEVDGASNLEGNTLISGTARVSGTITLENAETIGNAVDGTIALGGAVDVTGASLQYGPNDLYPLGEASSGFQVSHSYDTITGTLAVVHGLTSPIIPFCQLGQAPSAVAGEAYKCWVEIAGSVMTITVVSSDTVEATSPALVYWAVFGTP